MLIGLIPIEKGEPATWVRVGGEVPALMANTEMFKEPELPTYRKVPAESMASRVGAVPTTVRGVTSLSPPVGEIANTEMFKEPELPTYRKVPAESMASRVGAVPTTVRGVTSLSPPVVEIVNKETSPSPAFAASRNFFDGWITMDCTAGPAVIGLPASCVSMPELGSSR